MDSVTRHLMIAGRQSDVAVVLAFTEVAQPIAAPVIENENPVVIVILCLRTYNRTLQDGLLLVVSGYQQIDTPVARPRPGKIARGHRCAIGRWRQEDEQPHAAE